MASIANRRQAALCALLEALPQVLIDQGLSDPAFAPLAQDATATCRAACYILDQEPNNGAPDVKELKRIRRAMRLFQKKSFLVDLFNPVHAVSMLICLIGDQLTYIGAGRKRDAFESMLHATENLMVYFDPGCEYQDRAGFDAAVLFEELEL